MKIMDLSRLKALIVDDDRDLCEFLALFLSSKGISVKTANTGEEAVDLLRKEDFDLIFLDQNLPDAKGLDLVSKGLIKKDDVYVVVITGDYTKENIESLIRCGGFNEFVGKPFRLDEIELTLFRASGYLKKRMNFEQAVKSIERFEMEITIGNDLHLTREIARIVTRNVKEAGFWDDDMLCQVAIGEAIINAILHGNLEIPSESLNIAKNGFWSEVERRKNIPPYKDRKVHINVRMDRREFRVTIKDEGKGFDWRNISQPSPLDKVYGRGLAVMKVAFDEVLWNEVGNEVTLIKKKPNE